MSLCHFALCVPQSKVLSSHQCGGDLFKDFREENRKDWAQEGGRKTGETVGEVRLCKTERELLEMIIFLREKRVNKREREDRCL